MMGIIAIGLDVIKAFASFLQDRVFRVRADGTQFQQRLVNAGVSQGSLLEPVLYNMDSLKEDYC